MGRRSIAVLALICAAVVALGVLASTAAAGPGCAEAVLDDWTRGALDSSYSPECYEAAIDALPEDLRAYTTASDDIRRAGIDASRATAGVVDAAGSSQQSASETQGGDLRDLPTEVVVLVALLAVLGSGGLAAALVRRRRREE